MKLSAKDQKVERRGITGKIDKNKERERERERERKAEVGRRGVG